MEGDLTGQRQQGHLLLDRLPEEKFVVVRSLLEVLSERPPDTLSRSLASVATEDEELTPETMAALHLASAALDRGESVSHEAVLREFGL